MYIFKIRLSSLAIAIGTLIEPENPTTKTSRAEITLKSATLPRRKSAKAEFQLDMAPKVQLILKIVIDLINMLLFRNYRLSLWCASRLKCNIIFRTCEALRFVRLRPRTVHYQYRAEQPVLSHRRKSILFPCNGQTFPRTIRQSCGIQAQAFQLTCICENIFITFPDPVHYPDNQRLNRTQRPMSPSHNRKCLPRVATRNPSKRALASSSYQLRWKVAVS